MRPVGRAEEPFASQGEHINDRQVLDGLPQSVSKSIGNLKLLDSRDLALLAAFPRFWVPILSVGAGRPESVALELSDGTVRAKEEHLIVFIAFAAQIAEPVNRSGATLSPALLTGQHALFHVALTTLEHGCEANADGGKALVTLSDGPSYAAKINLFFDTGIR
jgi:hypothetical protein